MNIHVTHLISRVVNLWPHAETTTCTWTVEQPNFDTRRLCLFTGI